MSEDERLVTLVHDLRTPLTIILGFSELLSRRGEDLAIEQRSEFVERIEAAAKDMKVILDTARSGDA